jgi:uncharacterized 2Fe-2S/4Fe-4S cluster protein (DUF4445 family)
VNGPAEMSFRIATPGRDAVRTVPIGHGQTVADLLEVAGFPLNTRCGQRGLCRGCEVTLYTGRVLARDRLLMGPQRVRTCQCEAFHDTVLNLYIPAANRLGHTPQITDTFSLAVVRGREALYPWTAAHPLGVAVDVGTTTIALILVNLRSGEVLTTVSGYNRQVEFADNVLSRIEYAAGGEVHRSELQRALVDRSLAPLLAEALRHERVESSLLAGIVITGNTTMLHLLTGADPTPLGVAPFRAAFLEGRALEAGALGWSGLDPACPVRLLPGLSAYVGADLTAGLFATGMVYKGRTALLVDVGTNGEIVLQQGGRRLACATAAGPAFEGSGLSSGSRAVEGAVCAISWDAARRAFTWRSVGEVPVGEEIGFCGSAYLGFLAEGRRGGLLTPRGRFDPEVWKTLAHERFIDAEGGKGILLAAGPARALKLTELDVALLLQAKAAIAAGILTLLELAGLGPEAVETLYLAGSFGRHLNLDHALACGLLPGFAPTRWRSSATVPWPGPSLPSATVPSGPRWRPRAPGPRSSS